MIECSINGTANFIVDEVAFEQERMAHEHDSAAWSNSPLMAVRASMKFDSFVRLNNALRALGYIMDRQSRLPLNNERTRWSITFEIRPLKQGE